MSHKVRHCRFLWFQQLITRNSKTICDYPHYTGEETEGQTAEESCPRPHCEERRDPGSQSSKREAQCLPLNSCLLRRSECKKKKKCRRRNSQQSPREPRSARAAQLEPQSDEIGPRAVPSSLGTAPILPSPVSRWRAQDTRD